MKEQAEFKLQRGGTLLFERGGERRAGEVIGRTGARAVIQFSERLWEEVETGQTIELHYWHDRKTCFRYQAEIRRMGAQHRQIEVTILEERLERRQHRRFEVPVPVSATVLEAAGAGLAGRTFAAETRNISLGGLLLETSLELKVGDRLELELKLGPNERLTAPVWVVRSRKIKRKGYVGTVVMKTVHALGMEFQLGEEDRRRLLRFLIAEAARAPESRSSSAHPDSCQEAVSLARQG